MNILVLNGSPRPNGSTAGMIKTFKTEAESAGPDLNFHIPDDGFVHEFIFSAASGTASLHRAQYTEENTMPKFLVYI